MPAAVISAGLECLQQLLAFLESLLRVLQGAKVQGDEDEGWAVVLSNLRQLAYPINDLGASEPPPTPVPSTPLNHACILLFVQGSYH